MCAATPDMPRDEAAGLLTAYDRMVKSRAKTRAKLDANAEPYRHRDVSEDEGMEVIKAAYGWTLGYDGTIYGLVAGDMGYDATHMIVPLEHLAAWSVVADMHLVADLEDQLTAAQATITELTAANHALVAQMGAAVDAAVRQEREQCAVIAETAPSIGRDLVGSIRTRSHIAAAIRARSEATP